MSKSIIQQIRDVAHREWKRMLSHPVYLLSSIIAMLFCYVFFLTLMSEGLPKQLPIGIVDSDNSSLSRALERNINASPQVEIIAKYASYTEARKDMQKGHIYAIVDIAPGFQADLLANRQPSIAYYVNDVYLVAGSLSYKDLTYISELMSGFILQQSLQAKGITSEENLMSILQPISIDTHQIGNPYTNYSVYLSNILLPGVLQLLIIMFTIYAIGVEMKQNTTREWLSTSNESILSALTGKIIPHTVLFTILGLMGLFLQYKVMKFPMNGNIVLMSLAMFLFVIAHQSIGIFIIGLFQRLRDSISLGVFYGLLSFTFSGLTFPIEAMPRGAQIFAWLFPIRYYFKIYVNEALNGANIRYSLIYFAVMLLFLLLPFLVYRRLRSTIVAHDRKEIKYNRFNEQFQ
ncbi:MAG: ABC transporter permease [Dysgonamonadaceae bacterium]|nr:ABC transporter permease [Dysgonamonadaceae bacterium]MDD3308908.1 ABC transporter permease [Dysgonamonadaceae bacterium]MDD3900237.1 ABC transporter permease [Dysgonamonadaceae bacterium]MDD4398475.1 ABC transporter permease [Dysgonamonadaceae bacterium]